MSRICLPVIIALVVLQACDSQPMERSGGLESTGARAGFRPDVVAKASVAAEGGYVAGDLYLDSMFTIVDTKPLLKFESMSMFEDMAAALGVLSLKGDTAITVSRYSSAFLKHGDVAPVEELSLTDSYGRVIIGDTLYQIEEGETIARSVFDMAILESHAYGGGIHASSGKINPDGEDKVGFSDSRDITYYNPNTGQYETFAVVAMASHNAYKTWLGAKRANAMTEILRGPAGMPSYSPSWSSIQYQQWWNSLSDVHPSVLPLSYVQATVYVRDGGCKEHGPGTFESMFPSGSSKIHVKAGGGRQSGYGVSKSVHLADVGVGGYFLMSLTMNGEETVCR